MEHSEEIVVSLDPETFETTEQSLMVRLGGDILTPIEKDLRGHYYSSKDDPHLNIRTVPNTLYRSLKSITAVVPGLKLSDVTRVAARRGAQMLWILPGVGELTEIHNSLIREASQEMQVLNWIESGRFNLENNDTTRLHGRIREGDREMLNSLADGVGLRNGSPTIIILALAAGILGSKQIPIEYNNEFVRLIGRFSEWIKERLTLAKHIQAVISKKNTPSEKRLTVVDLFEMIEGY